MICLTSVWRRAGLSGLALVIGATLAHADNVDLGLKVYRDKVECSRCHGWAADGKPEDPHAPAGANIRVTSLTRDQLAEVIKCGRIGTAMPHFDGRAYKDDRCYGVTAEELGDQVPPPYGSTLIQREIDAVADYLEAKVVGKGTPTREQCEEYWGGSSRGCDVYPAAADVPATPVN